MNSEPGLSNEAGERHQGTEYRGRRLGLATGSVFTEYDFEQVIKLPSACLLLCQMGLGVLGELNDNTREEDLA